MNKYEEWALRNVQAYQPKERREYEVNRIAVLTFHVTETVTSEEHPGFHVTGMVNNVQMWTMYVPHAEGIVTVPKLPISMTWNDMARQYTSGRSMNKHMTIDEAITFIAMLDDKTNWFVELLHEQGWT